jgi:CRISPR/Cas system-associated endonuclease Cas1
MTKFPESATREHLERLGARYLTTLPFNYQSEENKTNTKRRIEYMVYEDNQRLMIWKREILENKISNEPFKIHFEATITKKYS